MGYRIELEEIEQAIGKLPNVRENAVGYGKKENINQIVCWISHSSNINKINSFYKKLSTRAVSTLLDLVNALK